MARQTWRWLGLAVVVVCLGAPVARAGEPVAGVDVGAAIPISTFKKTADVGGSIAPFLGYRFAGEGFAISLLGQPQFVGFRTTVNKDPDSDITSLFVLTAGPRFSLIDEGKEVFVSAQGGLYSDLTGPLNDNAGGYAIAGGFNYALNPDTLLGLFLRRDEASMRAARGSNDDLTFLTTGLSFEHRFLPPPPVVAEVPPPPPPAPAPPPVKKKIVLRGVHFDFDKATIRAEDRPILDEAVNTLKEYGTIAIAVDGHTDSVGTDQYNQKLSERRARAVAGYLADHGIARSRMTVEGFGESKPVASNDTADGRAQNRRVELRVTSEPE